MAKTGKANISQLAELTGLDRATIGRRLINLTPEIGEKSAKYYDTLQAMSLLVGNNAPQDEETAKNRKLNADADRAELRVKQLRGELVSADAMKNAAAELVKTLYQRTVRVTPTILASKLISKSDPLDIETIIRAELAAVFDELRSLPENFLSVTGEDVVDSEDSE